MNKWLYLLSILIFFGVAVLCYLSLATKRDMRALKRYEVVLLVMVVFGLFFAATEFFALQWGAWFYYSDQTFNIRWGSEVETYLFSAVMAGLVALATLVGAARLDTMRTKVAGRKHSRKKR